MGLRFSPGGAANFVRCTKIMTLELTLAIKKLGTTPWSVLAGIESAIRRALQL
jgi:hypothetical protein